MNCFEFINKLDIDECIDVIPINSEFLDLSNESEIISNDIIKIYFGSKGIRYFTLNDVEIIPLKNSLLTVIIDLNNYKTEIQTTLKLSILQRTTSDCKINLFSNDELLKQHNNIFSGTITIKGSCQIIQKKSYINDN